MMRLPFIGVTNINDKLSPIITRLPFIGVTNFNNELYSIMMTNYILTAPTTWWSMKHALWVFEQQLT